MKKRLMIGIFAMLILMSALPINTIVFADNAQKYEEVTAGIISPSNEAIGYSDYLLQYENTSIPDAEIVINADETSSGEAAVAEIDGKKAITFENGTESATLSFVVENEGRYELEITYYGLKGNSGDINLVLYIDNKLPFDETEQISFPRLYRDETSELGQDIIGNDIRCSQEEISQWITETFHDSQGMFSENYRFYLTAGAHTLTVKAVKEPFAVAKLRFFNSGKTVSYDDYRNTVPSDETAEDCLVFEAEKTFTKTSTMLYPVSDRSDAATTPCDPIAKKLNAIGGDSWNTPNQKITWKIEVNSDGLYKIAFRYKQNYLRGMYVSRKVLIDDELKFAELGEQHFPYGINWQMKTIGDDEGNPYEIYLEKGTHTITLVPTVGSLSSYLTEVAETVETLNTLYRKIIMVTGTNPDNYRDYYLQDSVPGLIDTMEDLSYRLAAVEKSIEKLTGNKGTQAAALGRMSDQLNSFIKSPNTIPSRLTTFRDNIISISSWVLETRNQSLLLDKFYICGEGVDFPEKGVSFLKNIVYHLNAFFGAFVTDYETVGKTADNEKQITVWVSSGRDQAEVLKEIIDNEFTTKTGIGVRLSLAQSGLMQAIMANKAPDVALMVGRGDPVNYALRGRYFPLKSLTDLMKSSASICRVR